MESPHKEQGSVKQNTKRTGNHVYHQAQTTRIPRTCHEKSIPILPTTIHNARKGQRKKEDLTEEKPHVCGTLETGSEKPHPNCVESPSTKLLFF